jgi:hypothetical protein
MTLIAQNSSTIKEYNTGPIVFTLIDGGAVTSANFICKCIGIVLNSFDANEIFFLQKLIIHQTTFEI